MAPAKAGSAALAHAQKVRTGLRGWRASQLQWTVLDQQWDDNLECYVVRITAWPLDQPHAPRAEWAYHLDENAQVLPGFPLAANMPAWEKSPADTSEGRGPPAGGPGKHDLWLALGSLAVVAALALGTLGWLLFSTGLEEDPNFAPAVLAPASKQTGTLTPPIQATAGGRIAFHSDRDGNFEIYEMNADGSGVTRLTRDSSSDGFPTWSPDGARIAFSSLREDIGSQGWEIFVMNADGSSQTRLTNAPALDGNATWSPDGARIAFNTVRDGNLEIYVMNADGSRVTRLTNDQAADYSPSWSTNGSGIAFVSDRDGNREIYAMNTEGSGVARLTNDPNEDSSPSWSPDGAKIAFVSDRDSNLEIYVMNADGSGVTRLTNHPAENSSPSWSPDGARIVFESDRDGNLEIYAMNADGSNQVNISNNPGVDAEPSWGP